MIIISSTTPQSYHQTGICLTNDAIILTGEGETTVADLCIGDDVFTRDNGLQTIVSLEMQTLQQKERPHDGRDDTAKVDGAMTVQVGFAREQVIMVDGIWTPAGQSKAQTLDQVQSSALYQLFPALAALDADDALSSDFA